MPDTLSIENLTLEIKGKKILNFDRSLVVENGDVVAILGPNGAGKSTFVNCLIGQMPFEGIISKSYGVEDVGILFQNNNYGELIKVNELISLVTQKALSSPVVRAMIEKFDLTDMLNTRVGKLSKGEQQRLSLALILSRDQKLLIFDELTTGLDFEKRRDLLTIVKENSIGKTVLLVTHYFEEIFNWAKKILLLDKGNIVFWGTIEEFLLEHEHTSTILIPKEHVPSVKGILNSCKDVYFIEDYEGSFCGILVNAEKEASYIKSHIKRHGLEYAERPADFYSAYKLALIKRR